MLNTIEFSYTPRWLGPLDYQEGLKLQDRYIQHLETGGKGCILGLEHPSVITLGVRGDEADIHDKSSTPIVRVSRGGQATLHNPGQLVIYPLIPIRKWGFGARDWVDLLLRTTQQSIEKCNIIINIKNNGLHSQKGKIASLGLNIQRGISSHGLAINVSNDLVEFKKIRPCGIQQQSMDRVGDYIETTPEALFMLWCDLFRRQLPQESLLSLTSPGAGL